MRLWRAVALLVAGSVLGLAWNAFSGRGLALARHVFIQDGDEVVGVQEAKERLDRGALFLDARPLAFYEMAHIPGARPLPEEDFDEAFTRLEPLLRGSLDVVVYCSGYGCEASHNVARKLEDRGVPAAILHEGWPAWQEAGYPEAAGSAP